MNTPHKITAAEIFAEAWDNPTRTPRSIEYRAGMLSMLRYQLGESDQLSHAHTPGTTAYDAWYAGVAEAWDRLAAHGIATHRNA